MILKNAQIFTGDGFVPGSLAFDRTITAIGELSGTADIDVAGGYVIPGLVDIHSHAAMGEDASDGRAEGFPIMSRYYASRGVTAWCPTTMTLPEDVLTQAMRVVRDFRRPRGGAKLVGVNLEGPFLCYNKRGAQAAEHLRAPDAGLLRRLNEASGGLVRLMTIAPELPGSLDFIRAVSPEISVSLGHTEADYATAMAAFEAGARHVTHLYNAMPPLHHRAPGVIGAALDAGATVELIADGLHVHPAVVRMTQRLFGARLTLISDSMRCAGMPDGEYTLGGQPVTVKNGRAVLTGTDTIAGSSIHLMDGLRRAVSFGVPLEAAVYAATAAPATVIGQADALGTLAVGRSADLVVLDRELNVKAVFVEGARADSGKE